jgi:hypothetical protein
MTTPRERVAKAVGKILAGTDDHRISKLIICPLVALIISPNTASLAFSYPPMFVYDILFYIWKYSTMQAGSSSGPRG